MIIRVLGLLVALAILLGALMAGAQFVETRRGRHASSEIASATDYVGRRRVLEASLRPAAAPAERRVGGETVPAVGKSGTGGGLLKLGLPTSGPPVMASLNLASADLDKALGLTPAPRTESTATLHAAQLRFNKPERMSLHEERVVEVQIALPGAPAIQSLGNVGEIASRGIQVGDRVRADLVSADFSVAPIGSTEPMEISRESPGQWAWRITPKRAGPRQKLLLNIYSVDPNTSALRLVPPNYSEVIAVRVTGVDRLIGARDWVVGNLGGIAGVIGGLAGGGTFLWKVAEWLRRRRTNAV